MKNHKILIENIIINYYKYQGDSQFVVIFLHGRGRNGLDWEFQAQQLEKNQISYFTLDFPGFGSSETPEFPRDVEEYSNFVLKFIKKIKIIEKKMILVGHSFGGRIAFELSARYPKLFNKIILFAPGGVEKIISPARKYLFKIGKILFDLPGLKHIGNNIIKKIGSDDYKILDGIMKKSFKLIINKDLTYLFPNIQIPIQIHRGKNDNQIHERQINIMQEHIFNVKVLKYENLNHNIHQKVSILKLL